MSWFKKSDAGPPIIQILSYTFGGGTISVLIGEKKYVFYYNSPQIIKTLEMFIAKKWYGKALEILNKLEKAE